jgi:hypothetical protein
MGGQIGGSRLAEACLLAVFQLNGRAFYRNVVFVTKPDDDEAPRSFA